MFTAEQLTRDLRRLGAGSGDTLMVHASLRKLGPVEGGAAGVVGALDEAVGTDGTLVMNVYPDESEPFDALTTPAHPDNGVLAEVFRTTPGTLVSDHPEGRMAARGAQAVALIEDVPWDHYCGPGSTLERLVEMGAKILRLGADENTVTLLHYAEYLADVPNKRVVVRHPVIRRNGVLERVSVTCLDDTDGIVDYDGDYFAAILRAYLDTGRASQGVVGNCQAELLNGREFVEFGRLWMNQHFGAG